MNTLTLAKKKLENFGWVAIPKRVYDELMEFKKMKEFTPTAAQKKALLKAEINFKKGKTFSYNELVSRLGFTN